MTIRILLFPDVSFCIYWNIICQGFHGIWITVLCPLLLIYFFSLWSLYWILLCSHWLYIITLVSSVKIQSTEHFGSMLMVPLSLDHLETDSLLEVCSPGCSEAMYDLLMKVVLSKCACRHYIILKLPQISKVIVWRNNLRSSCDPLMKFPLLPQVSSGLEIVPDRMHSYHHTALSGISNRIVWKNITMHHSISRNIFFLMWGLQILLFSLRDSLVRRRSTACQLCEDNVGLGSLWPSH